MPYISQTVELVQRPLHSDISYFKKIKRQHSNRLQNKWQRVSSKVEYKSNLSHKISDDRSFRKDTRSRMLVNGLIYRAIAVDSNSILSVIIQFKMN